VSGRPCLEDPLTKYDNIKGYLFNIGMLKNVFTPAYTMHSMHQTGDWEVTTRWTMAGAYTRPLLSST
jgi:hypothetical protein